MRLMENKLRINSIVNGITKDETFWLDKINSLGFKVAKQKERINKDDSDAVVEPHLELIYNKGTPFVLLQLVHNNNVVYPPTFPTPILQKGTPGKCPLCDQMIPALEPHMINEIKNLKQKVDINANGNWDLNITANIKCLFTKKISKEKRDLILLLKQKYPPLRSPSSSLAAIVDKFITQAQNVISLCS